MQVQDDYNAMRDSQRSADAHIYIRLLPVLDLYMAGCTLFQ